MQEIQLRVTNVSAGAIQLAGVGFSLQGPLAAPVFQWYGPIEAGETVERVAEVTPYDEGPFQLLAWANKNQPFEYVETLPYTDVVLPGDGGESGGGW